MATTRGVMEFLGSPMVLMGMVVWILAMVVFMFKKDRSYGRFAFWTFFAAGIIAIAVGYGLSGKAPAVNRTAVDAIPVTLQEGADTEPLVAPPSVPEAGAVPAGETPPSAGR